jgi:hypothetical protein
MTKIRPMQLISAGAMTVAALALFGGYSSGPQTAVAAPAVASSGTAGRIIPVNDDDVFNPSSGDIFTQNAQDQSTANGAGT